MRQTGTNIERRARQVIIDNLNLVNDISAETVVDLIRPHVTVNVEVLVEQALKKVANNIIRAKKDEDGVRDFFKGKNRYINISKTTEINDVYEVMNQIDEKIGGLRKSRKKLGRKALELQGQMKLEAVERS